MNSLAILPPIQELNRGFDDTKLKLIEKLRQICYNKNRRYVGYNSPIVDFILGDIEREELNRRELNNKLHNIFEQSSLSVEECALAVSEVLHERALAENSTLDARPQAVFESVAANSGALASHIALPNVAPELFQNRTRPESPIAYYDRVWRGYAEAGVLFQDQLRKLDPKLIPAIHTHCSRHQLDPKDHLPPPRHERTKRLAASGDVSAIANLHNAERLRAWRSKHGPPPV